MTRKQTRKAETRENLPDEPQTYTPGDIRGNVASLRELLRQMDDFVKQMEDRAVLEITLIGKASGAAGYGRAIAGLRAWKRGLEDRMLDLINERERKAKKPSVPGNDSGTDSPPPALEK